MNQILYFKTSKKHFFYNIIYISIITIFVSFFSLLFRKYKHTHLIQKTQLITNTYNISRLYTNYQIKINDIIQENNKPYIIGTITIPKINLKYPIFSITNEETLENSICRFYGPLPNEYGNLCIAGHNYKDGSFFGKLYLLEINDKIIIQDFNNNSQIYKIYNIFEAKENDLNCTLQDYSKKEITLITCNNIKGNRLIIKAI